MRQRQMLFEEQGSATKVRQTSPPASDLLVQNRVDTESRAKTNSTKIHYQDGSRAREDNATDATVLSIRTTNTINTCVWSLINTQHLPLISRYHAVSPPKSRSCGVIILIKVSLLSGG